MLKRLFNICFALMLVCVSASAVPAKRGVKRTVTLGDGTKVELTLRGDEHYKFYTSSDGFAYREKKSGFERVSLAEVRNQWKGCITRANAARRSRRRALDVPNTYTGKKKGLVILMQYKDLSFVTENVLDKYKDFFNKENYTEGGMAGSVKDYFKAQSYGNFELDFDVVGPFTAPGSMAYYGENIYDKESESETDAHPAELIYEACKMADSQVNFADYDWNGDGLVDQVFVIYAGYAESQGGAPETIWPHEWALEGENITLDLDGVHISTYACASELCGATGTDLDGIGTACHEFSHCLGLPDFYDTVSENYGMNSWDLMDQGSYNNDSRTPAGYTSYERMFAGWLKPTELKGDEQTITGMKALVDSAEAYILYNDADKNEYYLLENRQKKGFDAGLPGHGLLILHVDYDLDVWRSNTVNADSAHQRLTIIPADNELSWETYKSLAGDPFPGITGNTALTNFTAPAATLYRNNTDGQKFMNKGVEGITESEGGLISFVSTGAQAFLATPSPDGGEAVGDENSFKISWPAVEGAVSYQVELTEKGIAPSNAADALLLEFDFNSFVADKETAVKSANLGAYGLDGWYSRDIYASPNKLLLKGDDSYINTAEWNMPKSTEITVVVGADKVDADDVGYIFFRYRDKNNESDFTYQVITPAADTKSVFHFSINKDLYSLQFQADEQMYLNYLAVYNGHWSKQELGLEAANTRGGTRAVVAPVAVYDTDTNSYTFTGLDKESSYHYRVRAMNEHKTYSAWSDDKVFTFGTTGIADVLQSDAAKPRAIYNLQGRNMGTNPGSLPKGIYIIGGKKVVK